MLTMQGSIFPTILLHLLAIITLTTSSKLTQLSLNLTHAPRLGQNISALFLLPNDTLSLQDIRFPLTRTPDYMLTVPISLGTPPFHVNVVMDTGSALLWTQCQPCKKCYNQLDRVYNSRASPTFQKIPCSNPICRTNPQYKCVNNDCAYKVVYGGGTIINGLASRETFYFSNGAGKVAVSNVNFGCTNEIYKPGVLAETGMVSGIMGLNRAPNSILMQLFPPQKRRFSYCFSPFYNGQVGANTVLKFGDDVPTRAPALQTPFRNEFVNYYLDLLDVSVGNRRLRFSPGTFVPKTKGGGGFIIDSGCLISRFQKKGWGGKPYTTVIDAFKQYYSKLRLQRIKTPANLQFDLCYRKPAGFTQFATMTYHFRGADYAVDAKYTSVVDNKAGYFCVAVMSNSLMSVLGTWHQQNTRLVYDVSAGVLRFGAENCAADRS